MESIMRSCIQSLLKLLNCIIGMIGMAMILYAVWLIRAWQRQFHDLPFHDSDYFAPWFIYTFLVLGVLLCIIMFAGHIAAETANGCCLYMYMLFIFLLILLEAGIVIDVFLNQEWEEDFPADPSGSFDKFKNFIKSNFQICKWTGLSVVCVQGLTLLVAMVLKAIGSHQYYDSDDYDDDDVSQRVPLLKNVQRPHYVVANPILGNRNDSWSIRINDKNRINQTQRCQ